MKKLLLSLLILLISMNLAQAKTDIEKELEKREKIQTEALERQEKIREEHQEHSKEKESKEEEKNPKQEEPEKEEVKEKKKGFLWFGKDSKEKKKKESEIDELRAELKANEEQALSFIFQSEELEADIASAEKFFSQTEKQQLLELWRSTLARNRTIQFVIRSLSTDPDNYEQNNAVMQVLSRALFVPFYAVSAVADNALIQGGSSVGARVIGDVMDAKMNKTDKTNQVTRTDLIVLFMLVDEVAERLRNSYYSYKESKIEKQLLDYEIKLAQLDLDKATELEANSKNQSSIFFTKTVIREVERKLRQNKLEFLNSHRKLIELAGEDAVNSVDLLIDLEIDESLAEVLGV